VPNYPKTFALNAIKRTKLSKRWNVANTGGSFVRSAKNGKKSVVIVIINSKNFFQVMNRERDNSVKPLEKKIVEYLVYFF
jgi:hypothetical protein